MTVGSHVLIVVRCLRAARSAGKAKPVGQGATRIHSVVTWNGVRRASHGEIQSGSARASTPLPAIASQAIAGRFGGRTTPDRRDNPEGHRHPARSKNCLAMCPDGVCSLEDLHETPFAAVTQGEHVSPALREPPTPGAVQPRRRIRRPRAPKSCSADRLADRSRRHSLGNHNQRGPRGTRALQRTDPADVPDDAHF